MPSSLADITFDEQDANLFLVSDARLRADALKHSVLPRLRVVMNAAISLIREIYGVEALDDSIVSVYPNFRPKRDNELKLVYEEAFVGLGGKRIAMWPGFSRKDGKPVRILPFRFAFVLTRDGMFVMLENGWLKGLDRDAFERILSFHIEEAERITLLCLEAGMRPQAVWDEGVRILVPLREQYAFRMANGLYDNHFLGNNCHFPVSSPQLIELVLSFADFFPIYDSYIQMAKGLPHRLDVLVGELNDWMDKDLRERLNAGDDDAPGETMPDSAQAVEAAAQRVRVMPAVRWQVFQRDGWKCVACGRNSHDGAILHVDHILPRSRGGADSLDNFQTLCEVCNVGKSNRDATDLRCK
jgi:hypothetical protein